MNNCIEFHILYIVLMYFFIVDEFRIDDQNRRNGLFEEFDALCYTVHVRCR